MKTWTRGEKWPKGYSDERPLRCSACGSLVSLRYYLIRKHWLCCWCRTVVKDLVE